MYTQQGLPQGVPQPPPPPAPTGPPPADLPPPTTSTVKVEDDVSVISVSSRIPEFWTDQPRVWYIRAEAVITPQKISDEAKFHLIVSKLGKDVIQQVTDLLIKPPETNKYETLKARLLAIYEESENRQVQKLIGEMELGDQKPSQLLRRMRDLAREKIPDETLRILWQSHLPQAVRAVLAVTETKDMDNLAAVADKVMETTLQPQIAEVSTRTGDDKILAEIAKLSARISTLERSSRSQFRGQNSRNRSRQRSNSRSSSKPRRTPKSDDWLCFYHFRFRDRANKCVQPCSWKKEN
ncbi:hypothetical protein ABMA28_001922 [Loxostege sticticalis]|uniref:DUF7041 domain-containing protein n=1 Tax=Loxostege sticticalis TaxID=481309 RepID=A0ABD0SZ48_LOXSC